MQRGLPILMYHRIRSDRCPIPNGNRDELRYSVALEVFREQLDCMLRGAFRGVSLGEVIARLSSGADIPGSLVVLTFDDGNRSDFEHALPLLAERGFAATFFVTGNRIGADGGLGEEMVRGLVENGMEIGSHGMTHRFMSKLDEDEQRRECGESRDRLSAITGRETRFFAPPGGRFNETTVSVLRAEGYQAMCSSRFGLNRSGDDLFGLKRIPITDATRPRVFRGIIERSRLRIAPGLLRSRVLGAARALLGEKSYARLRSGVVKE